MIPKAPPEAYSSASISISQAKRAPPRPETLPIRWFVAYTFEEREDIPDIVVVVVLEFQGEGSEWAAPVARRVIESHFLGQPIKRYPWEERIRIPAVPDHESEEGEGEEES